jgi:hypothetical protein
MDPRQWISYALVEQESAGNRSTTFDSEAGPLVNVRLVPSGIRMRARVASPSAGNGEGEYVPFIGGDECIVAIPGGNERGGCVILGRTNNGGDKFPEQVAGADVNTNTFAFKRNRTSFIHEVAGGYLIRNATSEAFISITAPGAITLSDSEKSFFRIAPDYMGMQSGDGTQLIAADLNEKTIHIRTQGSVTCLLDMGTSAQGIRTTDTFCIYANGRSPDLPPLGSANPILAANAVVFGGFHATTIEGVIALLASVMDKIKPWADIVQPNGPTPGNPRAIQIDIDIGLALTKLSTYPGWIVDLPTTMLALRAIQASPASVLPVTTGLLLA